MAQVQSEMSEVNQELRVSREKQHRLELEKMEVQRQVKQLQTSNDHHLDEIETMRQELLASQDSGAIKEKELKALRGREKEVARQQAAELRSIQQQLHDIQQQHKDEIKRLEESHARVIAAKEQQAASHRVLVQKIEEERANESEEFRRCKEQAISLSSDMLSQQEQMERMKQDAVLKQSEIMRLTTRLSMFERQQQYSEVCEQGDDDSLSDVILENGETVETDCLDVTKSTTFPSKATQSLIGKYTSPNSKTVHHATSVKEQLERSRALLESLRLQTTEKWEPSDHKSLSEE
jgi:hypothetical protein